MSDNQEIKDILSQYIDYLKENEIKYPISSLDASSLYPSLVITYNLSPEYLITDETLKDKMVRKGHKVHNIKFNYDYENYKGQKCSKDIIGWTIRHDESNKENTNFGVYSTILKNMFNKRVLLKKELFKWKELKEHIEASRTNYLDDNDYKDCLFNYRYCDSKQKALKVLMNTIYGELGNQKSPLFILELAGAITTSGRYNIKLVRSFVQNLEHKIYYGDTDSIYLSCPKSYYIDLDKQYYTNQIDKLEYNTKLVEITFKAIDVIKQKVNKYLKDDNGTEYLKFSYEEVLWPVAFLAPKKYYGIPHEGVVNFKPKEMFIRGLEVKKRGVSEILKIVCLDIMWHSMDIMNIKTLRELVVEKIKFLFSQKWEKEDFIQTGLFKPEKNNTTLHEFVNRMKEEGKIIPEPYERFNYVIIKKYPWKYDLRGRKSGLSKSDKMEYLEVVNKNNYEIDLKYYFDKQLTGQFARLMLYDEEFNVYVNNTETNELEVDEKKSLEKCKKYILKLGDQYGNNYVDRGEVFKDMFKVVTKKYKEKQPINNNSKYKLIFNSYVKIDEENINLFDLINDNIELYLRFRYNFNNIASEIIKNIKKESNTSIVKLYNAKVNSFYKKQDLELNMQYSKKINELIKIIIDNKLTNIIFNADNMNIYSIVQHIRNKYNVDRICTNDDKIESIYDIVDVNKINEELENNEIYNNIDNEIINKIYKEYINIISIKKIIKTNEFIYKTYYNTIVSTKGHINKPVGFTGL